MTQGKGHLTLPMTIDVVLLDIHGGAMPEYALYHRRHFRGRTALELRIDAHRLFLHVPIDHDASSAIPDVPFRHQILIPGAKLLGIRGTGGGPFAPDVRVSNGKRGVGDLG